MISARAMNAGALGRNPVNSVPRPGRAAENTLLVTFTVQAGVLPAHLIKAARNGAAAHAGGLDRPPGLRTGRQRRPISALSHHPLPVIGAALHADADLNRRLTPQRRPDELPKRLTTDRRLLTLHRHRNRRIAIRHR